MKFFNWVHKRFNHHQPIHNDDDFAEEARNTSVTAKTSGGEVVQITNGKDTQALLKKTVLVDALDGWRDGILTIGTFGFDPLKPFGNSQKEYLVLESKDDDEADLISPEESTDTDNDSDGDENDSVASEDEEVNPLIMSSLGHNFNDKDIAMLCASNEAIFEDQSDKKRDQRTTLADLFLAETEVNMKLDCYGDDEFGNAKKQSVRTKKTLSFAKKLIPKVKDETSPIKNIQRLMKKMMKRKIHPELLDCTSQKSDGPMAASAVQLAANSAPKPASESASLRAI